MQGLVFKEKNVLSWEYVRDVFPQKNEVKIKIKAAGICGSDIHGLMCTTGRRIPPMIMGHEFSGIVDELGEGVAKWKIGDRVAVYPLDFCGECSMCRDENQPLCTNKRQFGVLSVNGAFAEYICVPEKCCFRLADDVSYSVGSVMEPLSVAYRAVEHAGEIAGKTVLIVGTGTIGLLVLACVKMKKPSKIFVSDLSEARLELARKMGADITINPAEQDLKEIIFTNTNQEGVGISFEVVGITSTCQQAMSTLKLNGTSVWVGMGKPEVNINMLEIITRELKILGTFLYGYKEFGKVVDLINKGIIDVKPIISLEGNMKDGAELFNRTIIDQRLIKVILTN